VLFSHFSSIFLFINGQGDNTDMRLFELFLLATKICELQITEWSPVPPVEKHNIPFLF